MSGKECDFARMHWFDIRREKRKLTNVENFDGFENRIRSREGRNAGRMLYTSPDISREMRGERRYGCAVKDDHADFGVGEKPSRTFESGKHSNQLGLRTAAQSQAGKK